MKASPPFFSKELIGKQIVGIVILEVVELMLFEDGQTLVVERDPLHASEGCPIPYWSTWK